MKQNEKSIYVFVDSVNEAISFAAENFNVADPCISEGLFFEDLQDKVDELHAKGIISEFVADEFMKVSKRIRNDLDNTLIELAAEIEELVADRLAEVCEQIATEFEQA